MRLTLNLKEAVTLRSLLLRSPIDRKLDGLRYRLDHKIEVEMERIEQDHYEALEREEEAMP